MDQMMRNQAELKKLSEGQPNRLPPYKPLSTSAERHYEYLEGKLLETRVELSYWREKCKELLGQQTDMKIRLEQSEKFKDGEKERLLERIAMLEQQNERLRRKDLAESQGFQTQLSLQRQKLLQLEKTIMKTRIDLVNRSEEDKLNDIKRAIADVYDTQKRMGLRM